MGWGQGIGIGWPNASSGYTYAKDLVTRFKRRVISAGGIFREAICLQLKLDALDNINLLRNVSLMITPNAFSSGVIYDVLPNTPLGDMDFARNSLAMRVADNQLLETNDPDLARLDFTGNNCPTWLVEPERTNLCFYSKAFTKRNTWIKSGASDVVSDVIMSPNGAIQGSLLTLGNVNSSIDQFISYPFQTDNSVTISLYVKSDKDDFISFGPNTPPGINSTYRIENFGFGWYRHIITRTLTAPGSPIQFTIGNGFKDSYYIWGAQLEIGAYATSHIQTTNSTITRSADTINKEGITDLIGQTEGTLFCDVNLDVRSGNTYLALANGPIGISKDSLAIIFTATSIVFEIYNSSILQGKIVVPSSSTGRFKIAAAYIEDNCNLYINGENQGYLLSCLIPQTNYISLTANPDGKPINPMKYNSVQVYKTKLSEAELIDLTTI